MGLSKRYWMEQKEYERQEAKAEWIREQLDNDEADEFTNGWDELSDKYDEFQENDECYDQEYDDDPSVFGKSWIELFDESIDACRDILSLNVRTSSSKILLVMLHAHIVSAVESYLSSTFIEHALSTKLNMRRLVESDPEFATRKFSIKEIFTKNEELKNDLSKYLRTLIFHDIAKVKRMYQSVLKIDFEEITWLFQAVTTRHHCVHRAGYDKDGNGVQLTTESVKSLIDQAAEFVHKVELLIPEIPDNGESFWKT